MSEESSVVTTEHFRYIAERTTGEDAFLADLKQAARKADIPPIWIAPEQASFIQILLRAARAREVVEVGTLAGYSAIVMARALTAGGRVSFTLQRSRFSVRVQVLFCVLGSTFQVRCSTFDVRRSGDLSLPTSGRPLITRSSTWRVPIESRTAPKVNARCSNGCRNTSIGFSISEVATAASPPWSGRPIPPRHWSHSTSRA